MYLVKNIVDVRNNRRSKRNLQLWEEESAKKAKCSVGGCPKDNLNGSHIQIYGDKTKKKYIIPLCDEHNEMYGEYLHIYNDTYLMLAPKPNPPRRRK
jgi:hypothetical protein